MFCEHQSVRAKRESVHSFSDESRSFFALSRKVFTLFSGQASALFFLVVCLLRAVCVTSVSPISFLSLSLSLLKRERVPRSARERSCEFHELFITHLSLSLFVSEKYERIRRIQVAQIRSEEHQIGLAPEKLLPMHASRLPGEKTGGKRRREVR
jgi:hypothetical protein